MFVSFILLLDESLGRTEALEHPFETFWSLENLQRAAASTFWDYTWHFPSTFKHNFTRPPRFVAKQMEFLAGFPGLPHVLQFSIKHDLIGMDWPLLSPIVSCALVKADI